MTAKREPHSPYARYNKRPYRYSDAYEHWHNALIDPTSDDAERQKLSDRHSKQFLGFIPSDYPRGRYPV